jgi:hypothetical protein
MQLSTYDDLLRLLKDYRSWQNSAEGYDYVGMFRLLGACLDNLKQNASEPQLKELGDCLEAGQILTLKKLAQRADL